MSADGGPDRPERSQPAQPARVDDDRPPPDDWGFGAAEQAASGRAPEPGEAVGPAGQPYGEPPPVVATVQTDEGPAYVAAVEVPDEGVAVAVAPAFEDMDLAGFRDLWPAVLQQLGNSHLGAFLEEAVPVGLDGEAVTIAFAESNDLLHRQADRPQNRDAIREAVRVVTGRALALKLEKRADEEMDLDDQLVALTEDELIDRVVQEFDATVLEEGDQS